MLAIFNIGEWVKYDTLLRAGWVTKPPLLPITLILFFPHEIGGRDQFIF
jgi:hypothetical protein